jgi:ABC-type Fe3+-hydroxamate transport system substrate-binding protein
MMRRLVLIVLLLVAGSAASWAQPQAIPARIVSTSPSITETLFALGLGDGSSESRLLPLSAGRGDVAEGGDLSEA